MGGGGGNQHIYDAPKELVRRELFLYSVYVPALTGLLFLGAIRVSFGYT